MKPLNEDQLADIRERIAALDAEARSDIATGNLVAGVRLEEREGHVVFTLKNGKEYQVSVEGFWSTHVARK